jgi:hypothetical protein
VSGPGGGPNWTAIFDSAHRRLARRFLLLAGIGAAGALLLLSSGLTANGTIKWPAPIPAKSNQNGGGEKDPECLPSTGDSADGQYEDCPPGISEEEDAEKERTEEEEEKEAKKASTASGGEPAI